MGLWGMNVRHQIENLATSIGVGTDKFETPGLLEHYPAQGMVEADTLQTYAGDLRK